MVAQPKSALAPIIFNFESNEIRTFADEKGEPWFCAKDVCDILGYGNSREAISKHCRKEGVTKRDIGVTTGKKANGSEATQTIKLAFINEGNLYRLIIKSKKPEAEKFEILVMEEILPTIRKTGRYSATPVQAFETLQPKDMGNITRIVWLIASRQPSKESWVQAVWYRLRQETNCPSPHKFHVNHLPIIDNELRRIYALSKELSRIHSEAEKQIIKRVLRGNENEAKVLSEIEQSLKKLAADDSLELKRYFNQWEEMEMAALSNRDGNNRNHACPDEYREPSN